MVHGATAQPLAIDEKGYKPKEANTTHSYGDDDTRPKDWWRPLQVMAGAPRDSECNLRYLLDGASR